MTRHRSGRRAAALSSWLDRLSKDDAGVKFLSGREADHLLERRPVAPPRRVGEHTWLEADPVGSLRRTPRRRIGPLLGGQSLSGGIDGRPERRATGGEHALSAELGAVSALDR